MSTFFDFNDAPQQAGDLLPAKTLCKIVATIRPGGIGDGGWLTRAESGFEYLNFEMTISSEPYARRKVFQVAGVDGVTDGHAKAAEITRTFLRGMLESARGVDPKDESDQARDKRRITSWEDLNGLEFAAEIGIEKGKDGYDDKNKVTRILTPDHKHYGRVMGGETIMPNSTPAKAAAPPMSTQPSTVPAWAR